jgi:hypothetical protein
MSPQLSTEQQTLGIGLRVQREPPQAPSQPSAQAPSTIDLSDFNNQLFVEQETALTSATSTRSTTPLLVAVEHGKVKKKRSSWIYRHMRDTDNTETVYYNVKGKKEWRCRYCLENYQLSGGSDNIAKHLNWHDIFEDSPKDKRAKNMTLEIKEAIMSAAENSQKRRKLNKAELTTDFDPDVVEILYVKFISVCNQSLRLVECPEFRTFLFYLNKDIESWLPDDHHTIHKWVLRQFNIEKEMKIQRIQLDIAPLILYPSPTH